MLSGSNTKLAALQSQGAEEKPKFESGAHNATEKSGGYTYSPSSTFQMAGNEQIQDRSQYKFHYVAMNPNTAGN